MSVTKQIEYLNFNKKENPELLGKLNAVAPLEFITVHALAQKILLKELNRLIDQYGITIDCSQPAKCAG